MCVRVYIYKLLLYIYITRYFRLFSKQNTFQLGCLSKESSITSLSLSKTLQPSACIYRQQGQRIEDEDEESTKQRKQLEREKASNDRDMQSPSLCVASIFQRFALSRSSPSSFFLSPTLSPTLFARP